MSEDLISKNIVLLKCCLSEQQESHTVFEPIKLKCEGNACKKCVLESLNDSFKCFNCNDQHKKEDFLDASVDKMSESLIKLSLNNFFEELREKLKFLTDNLKGMIFFRFLTKIYYKCLEENMIEEMQNKLFNIENEMDIRVESLISEIHQYRNEFKLELNEFQREFEEYYN